MLSTMNSVDDKIRELMIKSNISDNSWVEDLVFALSQGANPIWWTYMVSESDKIRQKIWALYTYFWSLCRGWVAPLFGDYVVQKEKQKISYEIMIQVYEDFVKILIGWCLATRVIVLHHLEHAAEPIEWKRGQMVCQISILVIMEI